MHYACARSRILHEFLKRHPKLLSGRKIEWESKSKTATTKQELGGKTMCEWEGAWKSAKLITGNKNRPNIIQNIGGKTVTTNYIVRE